MNADKKLSEVTRGRYSSSKIKAIKRKACLRKASANYLRKKK
jgi:hypothetical protein